jgi:formylglycine-generating enzyme required for sulfatase activity
MFIVPGSTILPLDLKQSSFELMVSTTFRQARCNVQLSRKKKKLLRFETLHLIFKYRGRHMTKPLAFTPKKGAITMSLKQIIPSGTMTLILAVTVWMVAGCANSVNNSGDDSGVESTKSSPTLVTGGGGTVFPAPSGTNFTDTVNGIALNMVFVQGGTYQRGCDNCASQDRQYETPIHSVTLSNYYISKYEVTQALWRAVMGGSAPSFGSSDNSPQIGVSWFNANEFLCKLNSITGKTFRLPTDAEWEFAARGGNAGKNNNYRYSGSNNADSVAWHSGNSGNQPHQVGTKAANELGIHDLSGNAWEWVYDWLVAYTESARTDPVQLTGTGNKTRRGGSYDEPEEFARVTRRAIRSRDGAAGMGFRIALSNSLPPGMVNPCEAANPTVSTCSGDKNRDCRLITEEGQVWTGDDNVLIVRQNGAAAVSGFPATSGEWYTLNGRSLNIVSTSGSRTTKTYAYYVFSEDEMTMINDEGMPYRLYKRPVTEVTGTIPSVPAIANPTALAQLIANVEPARMVSDAQLANPDTSVRDPRLIPENGYTWFFDGNCCGGNHKYRFHLDASGNAEFVVMDYDDTHKENVLARGRWFTVGNIALHIIYNGKYYNYLYTTGNRSTSYSQYMPAGPIFSHISFQSYERGDFRIFNRTLYDENIMRPKGFKGENPVYDPGNYETGSPSATVGIVHTLKK